MLRHVHGGLATLILLAAALAIINLTMRAIALHLVASAGEQGTRSGFGEALLAAY